MHILGKWCFKITIELAQRKDRIVKMNGILSVLLVFHLFYAPAFLYFFLSINTNFEFLIFIDALHLDDACPNANGTESNTSPYSHYESNWKKTI